MAAGLGKGGPVDHQEKNGNAKDEDADERTKLFFFFFFFDDCAGDHQL